MFTIDLAYFDHIFLLMYKYVVKFISMNIFKILNFYNFFIIDN